MAKIKFEFWNARLVATTIIESMVAMVIIVLSFGIGMMIYMNVVGGDQLVAKTRANILLQEELTVTKTQKLFFDETKMREGLRIEKEIQNYPHHQKAFIVVVKAINGEGKKIHELKEIVYLKHEN